MHFNSLRQCRHTTAKTFTTTSKDPLTAAVPPLLMKRSISPDAASRAVLRNLLDEASH